MRIKKGALLRAAHATHKAFLQIRRVEFLGLECQSLSGGFISLSTKEKRKTRLLDRMKVSGDSMRLPVLRNGSGPLCGLGSNRTFFDPHPPFF